MFLAWKELKHNKVRYALIIVLLTLMLFLVLFLSGLAKGLSAATSSAIDNAAADYYILDDSADNLITRSSLDSDSLDKIKGFTENAAAINLYRSAATRNGDATKLDITYMGIDTDGYLMPKVTEGKGISEAGQIVLNNSFKEEGFQVGDKVKDAQTGYEMEVTGFTRNQMYGHSSIGVIALKDYEEIQKLYTGRDSSASQAAAVKLKGSGKSYEELKDFAGSELKGKVLLSKSEIISDIPGHSQEQSTIMMMLVFLLLISSFIIGVFFYVTTMQKIPQFGVLKAVGARMTTLAWSLAAQVLLLSVISMAAGNVLTFGMASALPATMPFVLTPMNAAVVSVLFIIISLLASLFSMGKVARVDALTAIGGNE
ncbi:putative ABC transport system permease protein [Anaerocolumna jejuensis DSM 15929]|uniref:Putative hemin transport system permease protein HrtB n=1 Tax=Anaerocolumna jejuensis DSM 15929 TaxID=1121322 RepID=A0A1M6STR7_9FIRM|nr:ABC transporter permease [Anaerocolumna jejuensis]SHK48085.1 putative ABC transport system permease protein [Anaerocolumna jejuensis DSM 15929]